MITWPRSPDSCLSTMSAPSPFPLDRNSSQYRLVYSFPQVVISLPFVPIHPMNRAIPTWGLNPNLSSSNVYSSNVSSWPDQYYHHHIKWFVFPYVKWMFDWWKKKYMDVCSFHSGWSNPILLGLDHPLHTRRFFLTEDCVSAWLISAGNDTIK